MNLVTEQARLEQRMASLGVDRYRAQALEARQEGRATESRAVSYAMDAALIPMTQAVADFRASALSGRAGRKHTAVRAVADMEDAVVAFISTKLILDGMMKEQGLTPLAIRIGRAIELEKRIAAFRSANPGLVETIKRDLDSRTRNTGHRKSVFTHVMADDGWARWSEKDVLSIGIKLIEMFTSSTGLLAIEKDVVRRVRRDPAKLVATRRFHDWIATLDLQSEILSPEYLPCVIPPKDWDDLSGGGYHTDAFAYPVQFVKTSAKNHLRALAKADLSQVYSAVNAIQRTPWAVNDKVLEVATYLSNLGTGQAGLPAMNMEELPTKPHDIDTNEEARIAWKRAVAPIYEKNHALTSRRVQVLKTLQVAKEFSAYAAIYFPHQLDFRGRVYAVPAALNPQGTDLSKGLLRFSEGEPINTSEAERWFLIHGANTFGEDKVSFDARVAWVWSNASRIESCAKAPLDDLWWTEADSPFCFLAWCFEFLQYVSYDPTFRSHLAIAMDGSCNGLQHYSAMLLDPVAGKAVNLVPSDTPQDIYGEVARVVMEDLRRATEVDALALFHAGKNEEAVVAKDEAAKAANWLDFGVDRKITKRPVMVLPYGGTLSSCQKYIFEAVADRGEAPFSPDDLRPACNWLGGRVWEGIGSVVVSARLAMGWLRSASSAVSAVNKPLQWTTPSGFVVVQEYLETKSTQLDTVLFGSRYQPRIDERVPDTIDRRRQVNGVAPNFVHSLDAAALILTVNEASKRGVTKFAMIHDSYGTSASSTVLLASALRDEFVRLYRDNDTLMDFMQEAVPADVRNTLELPPTVGGLDLEKVRQSPYFFA